jgi:lysylphosphatidylglycerol synthetase-like protein (DUF2156 family)
MKFISIGQYFYKLYSAVLCIVLLPVLMFIIAYVFSAPVTPSQHSLLLLLSLSVVVVSDWLIVLFFFNKKIKSIRHHQGLRLKLEKYFRLTIVRYMVIATGCIVLAAGFFITGDDLFTGLFVISLILIGLVWPAPAKVSNDLGLKGDEREMVYYRKDVL